MVDTRHSSDTVVAITVGIPAIQWVMLGSRSSVKEESRQSLNTMVGQKSATVQ